MSHSRTHETIILQTYDIGEADRFCILLTKERGRLAARARGVRKLTSRMGGSLLQLSRTRIELHEGKGGLLITGAYNQCATKPNSIEMFVQAQKGIELLMQLLEDDDALPEIFDLTEEFLDTCTKGTTNIILPFTVRLLFLLGLLPRIQNRNTPEEEMELIQKYLQVCTTKEWQSHDQTPSENGMQLITAACDEIIVQHTRSELRVSKIAASMAL